MASTARRSAQIGGRNGRVASLAAFYKIHRPEKAKDAAAVFDSYSFDELCGRLQKGYGSLPNGWGSGSDANSTVVEKHSQAKSKAKAKKNSASAVRRTAKTARSEQIASLAAFYKMHRPEKAKDAAKIYKSYDFGQLCARLRSQYGGVPDGWGKGGSERGKENSRPNTKTVLAPKQKHSAETTPTSGEQQQCDHTDTDIETRARPCAKPKPKPSAGQLSMRHFRVGEKYLAKGKYQDAEAEFTTVLSHNPESVSALHSR
jgi:hypothetical protein